MDFIKRLLDKTHYDPITTIDGREEGQTHLGDYSRARTGTDRNDAVLQRSLDSNQPRQATKFVHFVVICTCTGGFLFGYDTGVISGALQPLEEAFGLSTVQKELVVAGTTFGAICGGMASGRFADYLGRKVSGDYRTYPSMVFKKAKPLVLLSSVVFTLGSLVLALAGHFMSLLLGRLIVGLGVGIASMVVPLYLSEVSPKELRGRLATLNTLIVTLGQVVAYIVNIAFANVDQGWRYMFGVAILPALFQLMVMPFMPESPRHLIVLNDLEGARAVLCKIYGPTVSDTFIDDQVESIYDDIKIRESGSYRDLFGRKENLRPLIIGAQQLCGFNTAMYYAATILRMAGFRSNQNATSTALIVAVSNMIFTAIAVQMIDRVGRRRMLVTTMLGVILGLIVLGGSFAVQQGLEPKQDTCPLYNHCGRCVLDDRCGWSTSLDSCVFIEGHEGDLYQSPSGCPPQDNDGIVTAVLLLSLTFYVASYALGLGYAPWLIQSELFSMTVRSKANGVSTAVNWICNLVVSSTFLSMSDALTTAGTFWFYAALSFLFWILIKRLLPETSGKSLEEIHTFFH